MRVKGGRVAGKEGASGQGQHGGKLWRAGKSVGAVAGYSTVGKAEVGVARHSYFACIACRLPHVVCSVLRVGYLLTACCIRNVGQFYG